MRLSTRARASYTKRPRGVSAYARRITRGGYLKLAGVDGLFRRGGKRRSALGYTRRLTRRGDSHTAPMSPDQPGYSGLKPGRFAQLGLLASIIQAVCSLGQRRRGWRGAMSASVSGHRATRRANLRSSFRLEIRLRPRAGAIVSYPENEGAVVQRLTRLPPVPRWGRWRSGEEGREGADPAGRVGGEGEEGRGRLTCCSRC